MSDREIMNCKFLDDSNDDQEVKTKEVEFRDPVVERVVDRFIERSDVGYDKYGTTLHEERTTKMKDLLKYLNDIQEELMDAVLYLQTAKEEIEDTKKTLTYPEFRNKYYNDEDDERDIF
jgi:hypothetical protein